MKYSLLRKNNQEKTSRRLRRFFVSGITANITAGISAAKPFAACCKGQGIDRAGLHALPAADTFCAVRHHMRIHLHAADPAAGAAVDAGLAVHPDPEQAEPLEQGIEGSQRADVFAERPVDHHRSRDAQDQQEHLPPEKPAERGPQRIIEQHMRHPALQRPDGTNIFAEKRITSPVPAPVQEGQSDHKDRQDDVLQISQRPVDPVRDPDLRHRDLIQTLL